MTKQAQDAAAAPADVADVDWKRLALYLASCHAATAEYDGSLTSTSKTRRDRLVSIWSYGLAVPARGQQRDP
jgi:hypothetical protein